VGLLGLLNIALPILLGVMGLVVPWYSDTKRQRHYWMAGFAIIAVAAFGTGILTQRESSIESLGGDQAFSVSFLYGPGMDPQKIPLAITNLGDPPIYDAAFVITRHGDFPQNGREVSLGTIYPREILRRVSLQLPVGDYDVEIRTKADGWFFERLTLTEQDGAFHQSYYVRRVGSDKRLIDAR